MRPKSGHKRKKTDPNACPCCKVCSRCTGFQKVLTASDAGYVLYRHTTKVEDINKNTGAVETTTDTVDDVFILENTQGSPLGKIDVIPDIGQSQIKCPRCVQLVKHAQKLLKNKDFGKSDIVGICEHCRKFGSTCLKCEEAVEKFQESRKAQKQSQAQRVKTWLSKIQKIIKVSLFDDKKRGHQAGQMVRGFSDIDLNNLLRQITKKEHEPEIQDLFLHGIRDFYSTKRGPRSERPYYPGAMKDKELIFHEPSKTYGDTQKEYMPTHETSYEREKLGFIPIRMKRHDTDSLMQSNITLSEDELEKDFILKFGKSYKGNKKFSTPSDSKWFKDEDFLPLPEKRHEYEKRKVEPTSKSYLDDTRISPESRKYYEEKRDKGYVDEIKKQDFQKRSETAKLFRDDAPKQLKSVGDIYHDKVKQREYDPADEKLYKDDRKRAKSLPKTLVDYDIRKRKEFITAADKISSAKQSEKRIAKKTELETKIIYESPSRIRRYRSEESLLTGMTKMKDDVQKQETFSYYFPETEESRKKIKRERVVSSSELIKDTLDKLKTKIEEERKKREEAERLKEERRKKLEQEKKEREAKMLAHKMEKIKEDEKHQVSKEIVLRDDQVKDKALTDKPSKEKIIKDKASKDKVPKEKASKEKASTEKVPKEKLPKDKEPKDKVPKENVSKDKVPTDKEPKDKVPKEKVSKDKVPTDKEPKDKVPKEKVSKEQESKEKIKKEVPEPKKKEKLEKPERKIKEDSGREEKVKESKVKEEKVKEEKPKIDKAKEEKPKEKRLSIKDDHEKEKKKRELEAQELKFKFENEQREKENQIKELQLQREEAKKQKLQEQEKAKEEAAKLKQTMKAEMPEQKIELTKVNIKKPSIYDLIKERNKPKERSRTPKDIEMPPLHKFEKHMVKHGKKESSCNLCMDSDYEFDVQNILWKKDADDDKKDKWKEAVLGSNIFKYKTTFEATEAKEPPPDLFHRNYEQENYEHGADDAMDIRKDTRQKSQKAVKPEHDYGKGIIRYALSNRTFIEKGWTKLPTEKVVRKMNVYRMRPAHPEFDWFEHNKKRGIICYDTGEKLAEFNENGRGQWFYRSGLLALDHYNAEEMNAQQRFVVYSSGEPDQRGRSRPRTVLATFDYLGNGIVFDHTGKIRLKYNQTEGIVLDRSLGPVSHWKWHTLNDPPVLQQVMIDTQVAHKDPHILKLGGPGENKPRPDDEAMLAIEFDNFIKEKSEKLSQSFKPFQIKMKALKINEYFSLRVLDQANVYLIYRDGSTNIKLNIGMILDHKEIVDTDTAEVGQVSSNLERFPAKTDSLADLQRKIAEAQKIERVRYERDVRINRPEPVVSVDRLYTAASKPLKPVLMTVDSKTEVNRFCKCRRPSACNVYYNTSIV